MPEKSSVGIAEELAGQTLKPSMEHLQSSVERLGCGPGGGGPLVLKYITFIFSEIF